MAAPIRSSAIGVFRRATGEEVGEADRVVQVEHHPDPGRPRQQRGRDPCRFEDGTDTAGIPAALLVEGCLRGLSGPLSLRPALGQLNLPPLVLDAARSARSAWMRASLAARASSSAQVRRGSTGLGGEGPRRGCRGSGRLASVLGNR